MRPVDVLDAVRRAGRQHVVAEAGRLEGYQLDDLVAAAIAGDDETFEWTAIAYRLPLGAMVPLWCVLNDAIRAIRADAAGEAADDD